MKAISNGHNCSMALFRYDSYMKAISNATIAVWHSLGLTTIWKPYLTVTIDVWHTYDLTPIWQPYLKATTAIWHSLGLTAISNSHSSHNYGTLCWLVKYTMIWVLFSIGIIGIYLICLQLFSSCIIKSFKGLARSLSRLRCCDLTTSLPWGHLKTTNNSAKLETLKPFCLLRNGM